jgi:plasmid maintenance system antidote protein VapI
MRIVGGSCGVPLRRINEIVLGKRAVTADTI